MSSQGREYLIIPQIVMEAIEKQLRREHGRKNMYEDKDYMREAAKTLHLGCVAKFKTDKYGHFDCDCSLCNRHYDRCELEDTAGSTPQDWGIE